MLTWSAPRETRKYLERASGLPVRQDARRAHTTGEAPLRQRTSCCNQKIIMPPSDASANCLRSHWCVTNWFLACTHQHHLSWRVWESNLLHHSNPAPNNPTMHQKGPASRWNLNLTSDGSACARPSRTCTTALPLNAPTSEDSSDELKPEPREGNEISAPDSHCVRHTPCLESAAVGSTSAPRELQNQPSWFSPK